MYEAYTALISLQELIVFFVHNFSLPLFALMIFILYIIYVYIIQFHFTIV